MASVSYHTDSPRASSFDPDIQTLIIADEACDVWYEAGRYYAKRLSTDDVYRFESLDAYQRWVVTVQWTAAYERGGQYPTPADQARLDFSLALDRYFAAYQEALPKAQPRDPYTFWKAQSDLKDAERAVGLAAQRVYHLTAYGA